MFHFSCLNGNYAVILVRVGSERRRHKVENPPSIDSLINPVQLDGKDIWIIEVNGESLMKWFPVVGGICEGLLKIVPSLNQIQISHKVTGMKGNSFSIKKYHSIKLELNCLSNYPDSSSSWNWKRKFYVCEKVKLSQTYFKHIAALPAHRNMKVLEELFRLFLHNVSVESWEQVVGW